MTSIGSRPSPFHSALPAIASLSRCARSAGDAPSSATVGALRGSSRSARSISLLRALAIATGSSSLPRSASACSVITWRTMRSY